MHVQFGNIYVTRDPLDPNLQQAVEKRFAPQLQRGVLQIFTPPDAWSRAVLVTPFSTSSRERPEDKFIREVLRDEFRIALDELT